MTREYKTNIKCPKCKSIDLNFIEHWREYTITFNQKNGLLDHEGNKSDGYAYRVDVICKKCLHQWKLRSVSQIMDIKVLW